MLDLLDSDVRQQLLARSTRRKYKKGDVLFWEADPANAVHIIDSGRVVIELATITGETVITGLAGKGDVVGEQALLTESSSRGATARALEPVTTRVITRQDFDGLRETVPAVDQFLIVVLEARVRDLTAQLVDARHSSAEGRVCRKLRELLEFFGPEIRVTQEVLASMTGTTRVTVNGVLGQLQERGAVELGRGKIVVLDASAIKG